MSLPTILLVGTNAMIFYMAPRGCSPIKDAQSGKMKQVSDLCRSNFMCLIANHTIVIDELLRVSLLKSSMHMPQRARLLRNIGYLYS